MHPKTLIDIQSMVDEWCHVTGTIRAVKGCRTDFNTAMVLMQLPTATEVLSFPEWLQHGRKVKHGEHSLKMLAGVNLIHVFDISQTEKSERQNNMAELTPEVLRAGAQYIVDNGWYPADGKLNYEACVWTAPTQAIQDYIVGLDEFYKKWFATERLSEIFEINDSKSKDWAITQLKMMAEYLTREAEKDA